jgi:ABC-2 type transport system ATP-binding protein
VVGDGDGAAQALEGHPSVERIETRKGLLVVTLVPDVADYSPLATLLVERGFKLSLFKEEEMNLETAFMALTKGITS